jgi:hypothetical protein
MQAASRQDIEGWLKRAKAEKATHVIVVCDTYDYSDYPVYVAAGTDVATEVKRIRAQSMTRIMEVYNLSISITYQMAEHRAFHLTVDVDAPAHD